MKLNGLVSEDGIVLSLGRVSFWVVLGMSAYFWYVRSIEAFPPTLYSVLSGLLLYNFSKKGLESLDKYVDYRKNAGTLTPKTI